MADLVAVLAIALELGVGVARIEIERPVHLTGRHVVLQEAERARLAADAEQAFVVARLGHEVDGAAEREAAEAQRVGALVDFDPLRGEELERLEVAEAVRLTVDEAVEQHVHAAQMEVVAQPGAADRQLALVGGAEARTDQHARREVEHLLEVGGA